MAATVASARQPGVSLVTGDEALPSTSSDSDEKEKSNSDCDEVRREERKPGCPDDSFTIACVARSDRLTLRGIGKSRSRRDSLPTLQSLRRIHTALQKQQSSQTAIVKSPSAQRVQLRATFMDLFLPKANGMAFPGFEFCVRCSQKSRACFYAMDAICLLQIHSSRNDDRLQQHAQRLYPLALTQLRREVEAVDHDRGTLMAAIYLLQLCEQFESIAIDGQGWRRHAQGFLSIVNKCKPDELKPELQSVICANARAFGLWDGILRRKPMRPCKDLCRLAFAQNNYGTGSQLNDIATLVPSALAFTDKLCAEGASAAVDDVTRCIQTIEAIERRMNQWFENLYSINTNTGSPLYWIVHQTTSLPNSRLELDSHVFPHAYVFSTMPVASIHDTSWICILALRGAQLDLYKHFPTLPHSSSMEYLRRSATHYADNLCMSIAFVSQPEQNYSGLGSAMAPLQVSYCCALSVDQDTSELTRLQMAAMWYKSQVSEDESYGNKLRYCEKALVSLRRFGLFPPEIH